MKRTCTAFVAVALIGLTGCGRGGTPGGPGAKPDNKPLVGQGEETFSLDMPNFATKIKQGETKQVTIGIKRGKNFDEDVTLKFEAVPKGVTVEPGSPAIKKGDTEAKVSLKAADDAALGDFTVRVTGTPTKGAVASNEFKVTVQQK